MKQLIKKAWSNPLGNWYVWPLAIVAIVLIVAIMTPSAALKLASLEGLLGAMFVVGGLVVAATTILTQLNLDGHINRQITRQIDERWEHYQKGIQQQARSITKALLYFTSINQIPLDNWREIEKRANEALKLDPGLEGVASVVGARFTNYSSKVFSILHQGAYPLNASKMMDAPLVSGLPREPSLPIPEAVKWLERARDGGEFAGLGRPIRVSLATAYALSDRYESMLQELKQIVDEKDPEALKLARDPFNFMYYANACRYPSTEKQLADLGSTLSVELPVLRDKVLEETKSQFKLIESVIQEVQSPDRSLSAYWCVLPRSQNEYNGFPQILGIRKLSADSYTAELAPGDSLLKESQSALDKLIDELCSRFFFVSRIPHLAEIIISQNSSAT